MDSKPLLGVTIGDPAGVGPEIVAKALADPGVHELARLLVFGTAQVVDEAVRLIRAPLTVRAVASPIDAVFGPGTVNVLDLAASEAAGLTPGTIQASAGRASFEYLRTAIEMAMAGSIDAIATAPINKESLRAGRVPYLDHTEMLAKLTGSDDPMTLFVVDNMRIFFLTRHVPLVEACRLITTDNVLRGLLRAHSALLDLGIAAPRIAVAGLNPHASDGGLFGREDGEEIAPAVLMARSKGVDAHGPVPADSVFFLNLRGRYDAVLSLYHDQGHIAAKTLDFERTVSLTLGIPFIRSSVDHGTAFDIAWKGEASATGMIEAIKVAARYAPLFRREIN